MVRFCFAKDMEVLEEACRRLESLKDIRPATVTVLPTAKKSAKKAVAAKTKVARRTGRGK